MSEEPVYRPHPEPVVLDIGGTNGALIVYAVVGTIELSGLIAQKLHAHGTFWSWVEHININMLGFIIVGLFVATWIVALTVWRVGRIEERWTIRLSGRFPN